MLTSDQIQQMRQSMPTGLSMQAPPPSDIPLTPAEKQQKTTTQSGGGFGDFMKGIVSAPATMIARPLQATAELAGASADQVDQFSKEHLGGFVAPVPRNANDVVSDVGRGAQTVALGMGPVAGGATFAAGSDVASGDRNPLSVGGNAIAGAIGGKILGVLGKPVFDAAGSVIGKVTPQFLQDIASKGGTAIADFAKAHQILPSEISNFVNDTAKGTEDVLNKPFDAAGNAISDTTNTLKGKITGAFKGKTPEEILATPETKLAGLSPEDRKVFYDAQRTTASDTHTAAQDAINQKSTQMESAIKAEGEAKMTSLNNETQGLVNQADRASINEAQSLKPKVIQSMKENSQTYRDLIDKEIAPVRDEEVAHTDLWKYIQERNLDNPTNAADIAKRLGLTEGKTSTIGDIYDQLKGLKQDIGSAGKKGTRAFTPDEVKTTDAISTLSDYLKNEKGINFTEANKFWSQYAPMRDKLIKSIQPFTPKGAETGTFNTFSKDIQNYVSGVKENKVDFISATENLLGTKIGNPETRAALENLTENQKAKFATKLEQENKLSDAKLLREQQLKDAKTTLTTTQKEIADKEFEANRQAQTRKNIWKTIGTVTGGVIGIEELKRFTGL